MTPDAVVPDLRAAAEELHPQLVRWRRHLHRYPELGYQEHETTHFLLDQLQRLGQEPRLEPDQTGLVLDLGHGGGRTVALRADIDALPIQDGKEVEYRSCSDGVMHACGHDGHTAILLGVAALLVGMQDSLPGRVRLIFQPAEEANPGGAIQMVKRGAMEGVEAILALHVDPTLATGTVGLRPGPLTASIASFRLIVEGQGGHSARPHLSVDPVFIASKLVQDLMLAVDRRLDAREPVILTIGEIHGGHAPNVIPDQVAIAGTVRTASMDQMRRIPDLLRRVAGGVTTTWGGSYRVEFQRGADPVVNDRALIHRVRGVVARTLGAEQIRWLDKPSMGGEDFSRYLAEAPGAMLRLGCTADGREPLQLHTSTFDLDEACLPLGVQVLAAAALDLLDAELVELADDPLMP